MRRRPREPRSRRPKVVYVVTRPGTARAFLRGQLSQMRKWGFDVVVIASPGPDLDAVASREGVHVVPVAMRRDPSPVHDAVALSRLIRILRRLRPDVVIASTPKAGLLGTMAAWAVRVPGRIYHLRGLRLETATGTLREILLRTERLAARLSNVVVCNSESLRLAALAANVATVDKLRVLGGGSSNGIDVTRFERTPPRVEEARRIRAQCGIPSDAVVVGFVGRMVRDKGIAEVARAWKSLSKRFPDAWLLLVGDELEGDRMPADVRALLREAPRVVEARHVEDVAPYYAAMDVLAFPSHREGLPNVPLEAGAAGLPVVGFCVTGVVDAVTHGETGTLVSLGDEKAFEEVLARYVSEPSLRRETGSRAASRMREVFAQDIVWQGWRDLIDAQLSA